MGDYRSLVDRIVSSIGEGCIKSQDLPLIVGEYYDSDFNCYPGIPGAGCHDEAFFISLNSKKLATGRGHITFRKALEHLVQHMQGYCSNITKTAIIITDEWDSNAIDDWQVNIEQIKSKAHIEAYLITNRSITEINI
jgi:hypothetical protein